MRISIASESKQLETHLRGYESLILVNTYSDLQTEYDRFSNDLNKVDIFAIIEYADISGDLTAISKLVQSGSGYLLGAKEILVILNGSTERTQNRDDKVTAFQDILEEKGFAVRVVIPTVLDFTSIYNAFIKNTVVAESTLKVFTKYKVLTDERGIQLKPIKTTNKLVPDIKTGNKGALKKLDNDTAKMLEDALMEVGERTEPIERTADNIIELPNLAALTKKVIFVTGVNDVGKTHSMFTFADELTKSQISTLIVDSTGKDDMVYIGQANGFQTPVVRGSEIFNQKEQGTMGVYLFKKAFSSTFLNQLNHMTKSKNLIFCEVGLDQLSAFLAAWDGDVDIVVVVRFDVTAIMELKNKLVPNLSYKIFVNTNDDEVAPEETGLLKQMLGDSVQIFNYTTRLDLFNALGGS